MRVAINLASEPFQRNRPMLVASTACAIVLTVLLAMQVFLILSERDRARDARVGVAQLNAQVLQLSSEQAQINKTLGQSANAQVLQRSLLLNALIERKSISWTRIFADLEQVKPYNVRVIQVRLPKINSRQEVSLEMTVGATDWVPITDEFAHRLEASPLFGPVQIQSFLSPSATEPLYQCRLTVEYAQKL